MFKMLYNRIMPRIYKQPFTPTFTPTVMFVDCGRTRKNRRESTHTWWEQAPQKNTQRIWPRNLVKQLLHRHATLVESPMFFLWNGAFPCHFSTFIIKTRPSITGEKKTAEVFRQSAPTFADVLVLQPQLPLDLFVRVPDGARLLETINCLLYKVVSEVPQNGDEVAPLSRPVQRMNSWAEGWKDRWRNRSGFTKQTNPKRDQQQSMRTTAG